MLDSEENITRIGVDQDHLAALSSRSSQIKALLEMLKVPVKQYLYELSITSETHNVQRCVSRIGSHLHICPSTN